MKQNVRKTAKKLDYLCLFDLECNTPTRNNYIRFNEVLELPVIVLDQHQNKIIGEYHTFVRPTIDRKIAGFCKRLTGITKEMAFYGKNGRPNPDFGQALDQMHSFFDRLGILQKTFALTAFTDFDGRQLNVESRKKRIKT